MLKGELYRIVGMLENVPSVNTDDNIDEIFFFNIFFRSIFSFS